MLYKYLINNNEKIPLIVGYKYKEDKNTYYFVGYSQITPEDSFYGQANFIDANMVNNANEANERYKIYGPDMTLNLLDVKEPWHLEREL